MSTGADLARELRERRSTTSLTPLTNRVTTHWDISKQSEPTGTTTSTEIFALHKGIIKVNDIQNFSSFIGYAIEKPSTVYEDNAGTIKAITSDQTTPTHRHHDVKISSVIYHKQKGIIDVTHSKSELCLLTLIQTIWRQNSQIERLIGTRFCPS
eukprot:3772445-Ditylum_brightwellii.AAC.1